MKIAKTITMLLQNAQYIFKIMRVAQKTLQTLEEQIAIEFPNSDEKNKENGLPD